MKIYTTVLLAFSITSCFAHGSDNVKKTTESNRPIIVDIREPVENEPDPIDDSWVPPSYPILPPEVIEGEIIEYNE